MRRRLARHPDNVDIVLDRLAGRFLRCLEQRADIDIETDIGKGGGDDLGAAVVAVLAELDDQHARPPPFFARKAFDLSLDAAETFIVPILPAIDAGNRPRRGLVPAEDLFERIGDLADRRARAARLDRQCQQIALAGFCRFGQRGESRFHTPGIAAFAHLFEARDLRLAHGIVVDIEDLDRRGLVRLVLVYTDDDFFAAVDRRLPPRRRLLDAQFRHPALDRACHAAERFDLFDEPHRRLGDRMSQCLDVIAAAKRIDDMWDAGLLGEDQLGVACDFGRERRRQCQRLVKGIGVQ